MDTIKMTSKNYFKGIQIVHFALIIGIVFFGIISIFLQSQGFGTIDQESNNILMITAMVFSVIGIILSKLLFKRKLLNCSNKPTLIEKLDSYRSALTLKFASIEAPSFLVIVIYLITGNMIVIAIAGLLLIIFLTYRPTKEKLITDLELSSEEKDLINNPDTILN